MKQASEDRPPPNCFEEISCWPMPYFTWDETVIIFPYVYKLEN